MMITDTILHQLTEGTVLAGLHWTEPVKVLTAKARGSRIEIQAVGMHTKRLWTKLLKPEEFDGAIKVTSAGELAALAAEAHRRDSQRKRRQRRLSQSFQSQGKGCAILHCALMMKSISTLAQEL